VAKRFKHARVMGVGSGSMKIRRGVQRKKEKVCLGFKLLQFG
jgi:hypothetical protein